MISSDYSTARLSAVESLALAQRAAQQGAPFDADILDAAATALETSVETLAPTDPLTVGYTDFATFVRATALLMRWGNALRSAEGDAARFIAAARLLVRDLRRRIAPRELTNAFGAVAQGIDAAVDAEDVELVITRLICAPLPVPLGHRRVATRAEGGHGLGRVSVSSTAESRDAAAAPTVAFLRFGLGELGDDITHTAAPVADVLTLQPDTLYDLQLDVRLSRWPRHASRVEFTPLHVEPPETLTVPTFVFDRQELRISPATEDSPLTVRGTGRLRLHGAHDSLARPLEVTYVANPIRTADDETQASSDGSTSDAPQQRVSSRIEVHGQRRLALRSYDPRLTPITGFPDLDQHLVEIRTRARHSGVPDYELAPFIALLTAVAQLAQQALTGAIYNGTHTEEAFQRDVRDRLRAGPEIGADLEEHPHTAGGIADLSFRRIRLELKVDAAPDLTVDDMIERYGQQAAQYVAASGCRCGILFCLDTSAKSTAPGLARNDIELREVAPPSGRGVPILLGVAIGRGNLAKPNALSKHTPRRRRKR